MIMKTENKIDISSAVYVIIMVVVFTLAL